MNSAHQRSRRAHPTPALGPGALALGFWALTHGGAVRGGEIAALCPPERVAWGLVVLATAWLLVLSPIAIVGARDERALRLRLRMRRVAGMGFALVLGAAARASFLSWGDLAVVALWLGGCFFSVEALAWASRRWPRLPWRLWPALMATLLLAWPLMAYVALDVRGERVASSLSWHPLVIASGRVWSVAPDDVGDAAPTGKPQSPSANAALVTTEPAEGAIWQRRLSGMTVTALDPRRGGPHAEDLSRYDLIIARANALTRPDWPLNTRLPQAARTGSALLLIESDAVSDSAPAPWSLLGWKPMIGSLKRADYGLGRVWRVSEDESAAPTAARAALVEEIRLWNADRHAALDLSARLRLHGPFPPAHASVTDQAPLGAAATLGLVLWVMAALRAREARKLRKRRRALVAGVGFVVMLAQWLVGAGAATRASSMSLVTLFPGEAPLLETYTRHSSLSTRELSWRRSEAFGAPSDAIAALDFDAGRLEVRAGWPQSASLRSAFVLSAGEVFAAGEIAGGRATVITLAGRGTPFERYVNALDEGDDGFSFAQALKLWKGGVVTRERRFLIGWRATPLAGDDRATLVVIPLPG